MGKASRRKQKLRGQAEPLRDHVRERTDQLGFTRPGDDLTNDELVCDFCGASDPRWAYPTDETDQTGMGWSACQTCYGLIEGDSWSQLMDRAIRIQRERYPILEQVGTNALRDDFAPLHDMFRRHRTGPAVTMAEWLKTHHQVPRDVGVLRDRLRRLFSGGAGADLGGAAPAGDSVLHYTPGDGTTEGRYVPEGFTPEQLADPRTIEYIMERLQADRPVPDVPLTAPVTHVIREWAGARTFLQAMAAIYGECPRADDLFPPLPTMVMAQRVLEPALKAHPLVLEPEQLNAIDAEDWSFAEAIEYAKMAHLPFEPLYLDFGGFDPVIVDLKYGPCRLYGAVVWRSGFFKEPTLAVAPIGGCEYLTGPYHDAMLAAGLPKREVQHYTGQRPGKDVRAGDPWAPTTTSQLGQGPMRVTASQLAQWSYQPAGICWLGVSSLAQRAYPSMSEPEWTDYLLGIQPVQARDGTNDVVQALASGRAIARTLGEERLQDDEPQAMVLTGLDYDLKALADWEPGNVAYGHLGYDWQLMADGATEMVARLAERALLALYFIENAPVQVQQVELSRPERREEERNAKKGRAQRPIASIIVIDRPRSDAATTESAGTRDYTHRWERRGHFAHYHENNRHYHNRPDLVKPCHKCRYEYELNERARRAGRDIPYPFTESPDCIKHWREPTVCGPLDKPLKKKVRIRRGGPPTEDAA